jgi:hypothetical protein
MEHFFPGRSTCGSQSEGEPRLSSRQHNTSYHFGQPYHNRTSTLSDGASTLPQFPDTAIHLHNPIRGTPHFPTTSPTINVCACVIAPLGSQTNMQSYVFHAEESITMCLLLAHSHITSISGVRNSSSVNSGSKIGYPVSREQQMNGFDPVSQAHTGVEPSTLLSSLPTTWYSSSVATQLSIPSFTTTESIIPQNKQDKRKAQNRTALRSHRASMKSVNREVSSPRSSRFFESLFPNDSSPQYTLRL